MNRPLLGLLLGGVLGSLDGSTAYFSAPELRPEVLGIVMGSAMKGLVTGLVTGFVVRRFGSFPLGALVGAVVALVLTLPIAHMNAQYYGNMSYYWKIILPGALTGLFVGYLTVRYGRPAAAKSA
ncbi:MAG: hypothetical protein HKN12_07965 [Gemmatimonadetes bacterium]|nr:hypothetical protein [Gemmatimonadota bacterium]